MDIGISVWPHLSSNQEIFSGIKINESPNQFVSIEFVCLETFVSFPTFICKDCVNMFEGVFCVNIISIEEVCLASTAVSG